MVCNKKRKPVFIKRKSNHVVFPRATILSFHPVFLILNSVSKLFLMQQCFQVSIHYKFYSSIRFNFTKIPAAISQCGRILCLFSNVHNTRVANAFFSATDSTGGEILCKHCQQRGRFILMNRASRTLTFCLVGSTSILSMFHVVCFSVLLTVPGKWRRHKKEECSVRKIR